MKTNISLDKIVILKRIKKKDGKTIYLPISHTSYDEVCDITEATLVPMKSDEPYLLALSRIGVLVSEYVNKDLIAFTPVSVEELIEISGLNPEISKNIRNSIDEDFADDLIAEICAKRLYSTSINSGRIIKEDGVYTIYRKRWYAEADGKRRYKFEDIFSFT
jgi:hypothetical protein